MESDRFFVLTGGPGAGKTTLAEALRAHGFPTTQEAGRGVIRQEMQAGGDALPWADRGRFAARMFDWELESYSWAQRQAGLVFFDRGLLDTIAYLGLEGLAVPARMTEAARRLRYHARVFVAPPWQAIYGADEERRQDWQLALRTYEAMVHTYRSHGYELIELPRAAVGQRVAFVLETLGLAPSAGP